MNRKLTQEEMEELEAQDIKTDTAWHIKYLSTSSETKVLEWSFIGRDEEDIRDIVEDNIDLLTGPEVAAILKNSKTKAYEIMGTQLPVVRIGRNARVRRQDLEKYIEQVIEKRGKIGP